MRRDDHELIGGLSGVELADQPLEPLIVESAGGIVRLVRSLHRIVQHDELDRDIGLGYEAVTGEVLVEVGLGKSVANRVRRGGEKLLHPVQGRRAEAGQGMAVCIRNDGGRRGEVGFRPSANNVAVNGRAIDHAHISARTIDHTTVQDCLLCSGWCCRCGRSGSWRLRTTSPSRTDRDCR